MNTLIDVALTSAFWLIVYGVIVRPAVSARERQLRLILDLAQQESRAYLETGRRQRDEIATLRAAQAGILDTVRKAQAFERWSSHDSRASQDSPGVLHEQEQEGAS
jgi:hypothetical protein